MLRHLGDRLTPHALRQIFVAIGRAHKVGDQEAEDMQIDLQKETDEEVEGDTVEDLAAGHSTKTATLHYGLVFDAGGLSSLTGDAILAFWWVLAQTLASIWLISLVIQSQQHLVLLFNARFFRR